MVSLTEIIQSIEPNLKIGGVFLTLSIVFFKIGHFFWEHERNIAKDNINKLRDILGHFKELFIRPTLEKKTREWIHGAYEEAITTVANYVKEQADQKHSISSQQIQRMFDAFAKADLLTKLQANDRISEFYSSTAGVSLLEKLDVQYLRARDYKRIYDLKISACRNMVYICFTLALVFLCGLLHLITTFPDFLLHLFLYGTLTLIISLAIQFVQYEYQRRKLTAIWEELKTVGGFDA